MAATMTGIGIFFFAAVMMIISLGGTAFWVWMLVDCAVNEPSQGNDKLIWILILVFTQFIGALIYYIVRRPERMRLTGR